MSDPHFKVGDLVRVQEAPAACPANAFVEALLRSSMLGIYEVTAILPSARSQPQYRLKGIGGRLERAVLEGEIVSAVWKPWPKD